MDGINNRVRVWIIFKICLIMNLRHLLVDELIYFHTLSYYFIYELSFNNINPGKGSCLMLLFMGLSNPKDDIRSNWLYFINHWQPWCCDSSQNFEMSAIIIKVEEQLHYLDKNYFRPNFLIYRADLASKSAIFKFLGLRKVVLWSLQTVLFYSS